MSKTYVLNDKQRKLVEKNLKIVPYFLRRLPCKNTEYEDLLSVGNIGLIKATATYDASANNTFGTYAKKCIENEFYMAKRKTKNRSKEISLESIVTCKEEGDDKISLKDIVLVDPTDITKGIEERDSLERTLELLLNMSSLKLKEKQVVFYRLGGMKQSEILLKHVLPHVFTTLSSLLGLSIGHLLGGTAIIETIFSYQGLGNMVVEAIRYRDYPIIQAYAIYMALIYVFVNLFVDIFQQVLNPRLRRRFNEKKVKN